MSTLAGQAALVTGGGSGIGLQCARYLVRDGATVTIAGRTESRLREAADLLREESSDEGSVHWVACDVADEDQVRAAVDAATAPLGSLHLAVAAAGRGGLGPLLVTPLEEWEGILATNTTGTFLTFKHAGAAISASGGGAMVAISSIAGVATHRFMGPYCVSKAAIDMLVRVAADELGVAGVRVNSVQPGLVDTDLVSLVMADEQIRGDYLDQMPVRRTGTVDDVAALVRFLLGPESSWITGATINVDGGHHLRRGPNYEPVTRALFGDDAVEGRVPRG
jgi:NAD(P)-dependent dehydrogenase (short-subunit alcohol dehydrogenase family)